MSIMSTGGNGTYRFLGERKNSNSVLVSPESQSIEEKLNESKYARGATPQIEQRKLSSVMRRGCT
jgi:hypothetical protein